MSKAQWIIVIGGTLLADIAYPVLLGAILGWLFELIAFGLVAVTLIMFVVNRHASALHWLIAMAIAFVEAVFVIACLILGYVGFFAGWLEWLVYASLIAVAAAVAGAIVVELTKRRPVEDG